jgi:hypothetical protein
MLVVYVDRGSGSLFLAFGVREGFDACSHLADDLIGFLRKSGPKQNANPSDKLPFSINDDSTCSFVYRVYSRPLPMQVVVAQHSPDCCHPRPT